MEQGDRFEFHPMEQFVVTKLDQPTDTDVLILVVLFAALAFVPYLLTTYLARKIESAWAYALAPIAGVGLLLAINLASNYFVEANAWLGLSVLETLFGWWEWSRYCQWGC